MYNNQAPVRPWTTRDEARGERIRELRREAGLTQVELAHRLGMGNERSVQAWEKGGPFKTLQMARRLAAALDTSDSIILTGKEAPAPSSPFEGLQQRVEALETRTDDRRLAAIEGLLVEVQRSVGQLAAAVSAVLARFDSRQPREQARPEETGTGPTRK